MERIIELGEASGISDNDYVMIDHTTEGVRKYPAKSLIGKVATKNITTNGTYEASSDDVDGYSKVNVNVYAGEPTFIEKTITQNGTYNPSDDNADGYSSVDVNVGGGGLSKQIKITGSTNFGIKPLYNNTDSTQTTQITTGIEDSNATVDNFLLDLVAYDFKGSGTTHTSTTYFSKFVNGLLNCSWYTQSGQTKQYYNIIYVKDTDNIKVLNDWTLYNKPGTYEFALPSELIGKIEANEFILDFKEVVCVSNLGSYTIGRTIEDGKLKITFPTGSLNATNNFKIRILYIA